MIGLKCSSAAVTAKFRNVNSHVSEKWIPTSFFIGKGATLSAVSKMPGRNPGRTANVTESLKNHLVAETNSFGVVAGLQKKLRQQKNFVRLLKGH